MLSFYRTNVEPIDQVKSNLSKIFPNAASLLQTNHPKSAQKHWEEQLLSIKVCWRKSSFELFPLAITHAEVAKSEKHIGQM